MKHTTTLHFSELLLVLLKGKTSIVDALHILSREGIERRIRDNSSSLLIKMKKGVGFSESLRSIAKGRVSFEPLYLSLITAAELTGNIESVLERIVNDLRKKQKAKETVLNILIYPSIVILLAVFGSVLIIVWGIPHFVSGGLLSADVVSDAITGIFMAGTVLLIGGIMVFAVYFRLFYNDSPEFRIFYTLDFLLHSNINLLEALSHCILSAGQTKYGSALVNIKKDIASGISFSAAFAKAKYFSPYVLGWLSVAGTSGSFGEICCGIKDYYAGKDTRTREIAARLIEPAVIMLTGFYILIIMATVVLPILTSIGGTL